VRLIFVHGWALGPESWDLLAPLLEDYAQVRIDLGFFGAPRPPDHAPGDILVGHSAGLLWGLEQRRDWAGVVAINSFSRFGLDAQGRGCVKPSALRAMQKSLLRDANACVKTFRASIGAPAAEVPARTEALAVGLESLRVFDAAGYFCAKTLVLAAADDHLAPCGETETLARISGGQLALKASGGHGLPWTAPDFCAEQIKDFCRSHAFQQNI
jgi:pimeloyl-[acyl-carrier protein] methyl ester esterase